MYLYLIEVSSHEISAIICLMEEVPQGLKLTILAYTNTGYTKSCLGPVHYCPDHLPLARFIYYPLTKITY
jgi:hypothetical protein